LLHPMNKKEVVNEHGVRTLTQSPTETKRLLE